MKIPATVITGFLGAGKTTLIRHLLENNQGKRIALIINEFGDLGIDREILTGCGIEGCNEDDVVELANGCICCTVADDFVPTMEALIERDDKPDHIIIETSGLALPKPLVKAFNWPEIKSRVTVDGVVSVIDAPALAAGHFATDEEALQKERERDPNIDHDNPLEEVFEDQLNCADMVILNKTDLLEEQDINRVKEELAGKVREAVSIVPAFKGQVDPAALLGLDASAEDDLDARKSHHDGPHDHDHDDFDTFAISLGDIADPAALEDLLIEAATKFKILRIKGFVNVPGKPMRHVIQAVGPRLQRYFDRPWKDGEARKSELVIIGLHGIDQIGIKDLLKADLRLAS